MFAVKNRVEMCLNFYPNFKQNRKTELLKFQRIINLSRQMVKVNKILEVTICVLWK